MSNTGFKVRFDENGDIVDILGGGCLKSTPEEKVRQRFIETLINEYHYPANTIRREVPIQHGSKELRDKDGNPVRADIVVEDPSDTTNLTPYLTANGALEQRRMTVKWFDMSRATDKQKECVRMLRVQKGDILISRSGTIGKVTYATRILADKYVISDDLVRVRVPDENMRAYLLAFLMSSTAMNLMKLDEFGSVQQHLQPRHIWGLPVPVPDSWEQVSPIIDAGKGMISAMEQTSLADESLRTNGFDSLIE